MWSWEAPMRPASQDRSSKGSHYKPFGLHAEPLRRLSRRPPQKHKPSSLDLYMQHHMFLSIILCRNCTSLRLAAGSALSPAPCIHARTRTHTHERVTYVNTVSMHAAVGRCPGHVTCADMSHAQTRGYKHIFLPAPPYASSNSTALHSSTHWKIIGTMCSTSAEWTTSAGYLKYAGRNAIRIPGLSAVSVTVGYCDATCVAKDMKRIHSVAILYRHCMRRQVFGVLFAINLICLHLACLIANCCIYIYIRIIYTYYIYTYVYYVYYIIYIYIN
jgi:hypothetical protein